MPTVYMNSETYMHSHKINTHLYKTFCICISANGYTRKGERSKENFYLICHVSSLFDLLVQTL